MRTVLSATAFIPSAAPGVEADQILPAAVRYLGAGLYELSFTPSVAGAYTFFVLKATVFEVQRLSVAFPSPAGRSGTYKLSIDGARLTDAIAWDASEEDLVAAIRSHLAGSTMANSAVVTQQQLD